MATTIRTAETDQPKRPRKTLTKQPLRRSNEPSVWNVLGVSIVGSSLLWMSFPPLGFWPLAWLAPLPWLWLIAQPRPLGRRGYWAVWLASVAFWLVLLQGIRLAHIGLYPLLVVLAAYVGVYLPLAVGMTRMLVHRWRWPLVLAAPLVWVGLEYVRSYFATGFSLAMLAQSQTPFPLVLQTADIFGAYGPSFLMMLAAASIAVWLVPGRRRTQIASSLVAAAALVAAFAYGFHRLNEPTADGPAMRAMIVQGCQDTKMDGDPRRQDDMDREYRTLTFNALDQNEPCDLVVWPESAFVEAERVVPDVKCMPPEFSEERYRESCEDYERLLAWFANRLNHKSSGRTSFVVGSNTVHFTGDGVAIYNAAFLISPEGLLAERYFKHHLVMFGEYLPFGEWFPVFYKLAPFQPVSRGREFKSFQVAGLRLAPNICFESLVSQLLVQQHNELASRGEEPDVLINTTNDGWFYGSAILDLHFQCAVLRAIENRKPFLIAANTGVSGVIDGNGRVVERGPNHDTKVIVAEVRPDGRRSLYHTLGDWPAAACSLVTLIAVVWGWTKPNAPAQNDPDHPP
jgi:apolipoprotein N-acyltransferase